MTDLISHTETSPAHIAAVGLTADVVSGDVCDLGIYVAQIAGYREGDYLLDAGEHEMVPEYEMTSEVVFSADLATRIGGDMAEAEREADRTLADTGWVRTSDWVIGDTAMYADVRADD